MTGTLLGRYWLDREIAHGGMARVHIGRLLGPVGFGRTVAIKRLHAHMLSDQGFVTMFVDEARLATRIQQPNVVQILDIVAEQDELFLVMEYVHGESVARLLASGRPEPSVATAIILDLLDGLHAAHEAQSERGEPLGIIHRDVSPQNVIVGVDGVTRVADFGIAKAEQRLLTTGDALSAKGKVPYMAPEQLATDQIDQRADVWAAAVVLWECLTGARLFKGAQPAIVMKAVIDGPIPPPSSVRESLEPFDVVVARGLQRDVELRYPTARAFAEELEAVMPRASRREVGEWVKSMAAAALAERRAWIADMELATPTVGPSIRTQVAALTASRSFHDDDALPAHVETGPQLPPSPSGSSPMDATQPVGGRSAQPLSQPEPRPRAEERPPVVVHAEPARAPSHRRGAIVAAVVVACVAAVVIFAVRRITARPDEVVAPPPVATVVADAPPPELDPRGGGGGQLAPPPATGNAGDLAPPASSARRTRVARPGGGSGAGAAGAIKSADRPSVAPVDSVRLDMRK